MFRKDESDKSKPIVQKSISNNEIAPKKLSIVIKITSKGTDLIITMISQYLKWHT